MKVQWNPVDSDTKGTCHSVRIIAGCPKKFTDTSFIDIRDCAIIIRRGGGGAEKREGGGHYIKLLPR